MTFTDCFIPTIILVITGFALLKKTDIFDAFLEGAKEGISTSLDILPSLICLMTCIGMFKSVGGFGILASFVQPLTDFFGFPNSKTFVGFDNYGKGFTFGEYPFYLSFLYSLIITVTSVILILLCTSMAAWFISRVNNIFCKIISYSFI